MDAAKACVPPDLIAVDLTEAAHALGGLAFLPWAPIALGASGWRPPDLDSARAVREIARALGGEASPLFGAAAERHLDSAMPHIAGDYMGEHWLASFALLALEG